MVTSEWYVAVAPLRGCFLPDWAEHLVTVSVNKSSDINWFVCWPGGEGRARAQREKMLLITQHYSRHTQLGVFSLQWWWWWCSEIQPAGHQPVTRAQHISLWPNQAAPEAWKAWCGCCGLSSLLSSLYPGLTWYLSNSPLVRKTEIQLVSVRLAQATETTSTDQTQHNIPTICQQVNTSDQEIAQNHRENIYTYIKSELFLYM